MEAGAHFHGDPKHLTTHPGVHAVRDAAADRTSGWVLFAGTYVLIAGALNALWGVTALAKKDYFIEGGLVWSDLDLWGSIAIVIAVVQIVTGVLLLARNTFGILMAIVVSMCALLVNFVTFGAYPAWSAVALVCNGLVLWAVTAHSEAFER